MTDNVAAGPVIADVIYGAPPKIYLHQVEASELKELARVSSPTPTIVASFCGGAFVSLLPSAVSAVGVLGTASFGVEQLGFILLDLGALGVAVYSGILGSRNHGEVSAILDRIGARLQPT